MNDDTNKVSILRFICAWIFFFPLFLYDQYRSGHLGIGVLLTLFSPSLWGLLFAVVIWVAVYSNQVEQERKAAAAATCTEHEQVKKVDDEYACVPKEDVILSTNNIGKADLLWLNECFSSIDIAHDLTLDDIMIKAHDVFMPSSDIDYSNQTFTSMLFRLPKGHDIHVYSRYMYSDSEELFEASIRHELPLQPKLLQPIKSVLSYHEKKGLKHVKWDADQVSLQQSTAKNESHEVYFHVQEEAPNRLELDKGIFELQTSFVREDFGLTNVQLSLLLIDAKNQIGLCIKSDASYM